MHRQRAPGAHHALGPVRHGAGSIDEGRGFAHHAADSQNHACQNAAHCRGQHDVRNRAQPARAQAEAALAVAVRDGKERFLRGAQNEGQNHHRQRHSARQKRVAPPKRGYEKHHAEQPIQDGRDARERFGGEAHSLDDLGRTIGVFSQIDRPAHTQRHRQKQGQKRHDDSIEQSGQQAHVFAVVFQRKQAGLEIWDTGNKDVADDQHKRTSHDQRCRPTQQAHQKRARIPRRVLEHQTNPFHCTCLLLSAENSALISKMNTNSTTPVAMRASRCKSAA